MGREGMGCPVELEFSVNLCEDNNCRPEFAFLQLRPMTAREELIEVEISQEEIEGALGEQTLKPLSAPGIPASFSLPLREARDQFEKEYLEYQLEKNNGSVGKVAQIAGVERTHLYRKLKALGIDPKNPRTK